MTGADGCPTCGYISHGGNTHLGWCGYELRIQALEARAADAESKLAEAEVAITELVQAVQQTAEELTDARNVIEAICRNLPVRVDSADFKLIRAIADRGEDDK